MSSRSRQATTKEEKKTEREQNLIDNVKEEKNHYVSVICKVVICLLQETTCRYVSSTVGM